MVKVLQFSVYRSFTSLVKFIPKYLTVFDAIVSGTVFFIFSAFRYFIVSFRIIIGRQGLLMLSDYFFLLFVVPLFSSSPLAAFFVCVWTDDVCSAVVGFDSLLFTFCESTVEFCYVVTNAYIKHPICVSLPYTDNNITLVTYKNSTLLLPHLYAFYITVYLFLYCLLTNYCSCIIFNIFF